jgi:hypothetical protein
MLVRVGQAARTSVPTMSSRVSESLLNSLTTQTSGDHKVLNSNTAEAPTYDAH